MYGCVLLVWWKVVIWYLNINFEAREIGQVFGVGKVGGRIPGLVKWWLGRWGMQDREVAGARKRMICGGNGALCGVGWPVRAIFVWQGGVFSCGS